MGVYDASCHCCSMAPPDTIQPFLAPLHPPSFLLPTCAPEQIALHSFDDKSGNKGPRVREREREGAHLLKLLKPYPTTIESNPITTRRHRESERDDNKETNVGAAGGEARLAEGVTFGPQWGA